MLRKSRGLSSGAYRVDTVISKTLWCEPELKEMCVASARPDTVSDGPLGVGVVVRMGGVEEVMLRRRLKSGSSSSAWDAIVEC